MRRPKKVFIMGMTGSGKTTLARRLSRILKVKRYNTDDMVYKKKWSEKYSFDEREKNIAKVLKNKEWIIEGVHDAKWIWRAFEEADLVLYINPKKSVAIRRIFKRYKERMKTDLPDTFLFVLKVIYWIVRWNRGYYRNCRRLTKGKFITLDSTKDVEDFIREMGNLK